MKTLSSETRKRYLVNFAMFLLFIGVTASSLYFLYVPGGYQGGRNPRFNMRIIFARETWEDIHVWTSFLLSGILIMHIFLHLRWIQTVFLKYIQLWKKSVRTGNRLRILNILDDGFSAVSFLICLFSGIVLFLVPGGKGSAWIEILSITRGTWKIIHTWSGVGMLIGVLLHLLIHWNWITRVSRKLFSRGKDPLITQSPNKI